MKQLCVWVACVALAIGSAQGSLVAHWTLDSDATDAGQFGFDGTTAGTVTFGNAGANASTGTSAGFNNSAINVSYDGMTNPSTFTFATWVYPTGGSSHRSVVTSRDSSGGADADGYIIYINPANQWEFWTGNGPAAGTWDALGGGAAAFNTWTHLAISFDETTKTKSFYINGTLANSTTTQGYVPNAHTGLHLGRGGDPGTSYPFVGLIDDASLWNEALTQAEIQALMTNSVPLQMTQTLLASFDMGNDAPLDGLGPFGGPSSPNTLFTKVTNANPTPGGNGVSARVYNYITISNAPSTPGSELTDDFMYTSGAGSAANWEIAGLEPGLTYDVYIVASDGTGWSSTNIYGGDYIITAGSADVAQLRGTGGTTEAFDDFVAGRDYVLFTNVHPDASGVFAGIFRNIPGQPHTGFAGAQVVLVAPEPATLGLLALGGLGILARRRRRA